MQAKGLPALSTAYQTITANMTLKTPIIFYSINKNVIEPDDILSSHVFSFLTDSCLTCSLIVPGHSPRLS